MKLSELTVEQVEKAARTVTKEVAAARRAAWSGNRAEAYAAAERAQEAAFELKQLFTLTTEEIGEARADAHSD